MCNSRLMQLAKTLMISTFNTFVLSKAMITFAIFNYVDKLLLRF
jgi:hypothetical protein